MSSNLNKRRHCLVAVNVVTNDKMALFGIVFFPSSPEHMRKKLNNAGNHPTSSAAYKYSDCFIRLQLFCFKQLLWHVSAVYIRLRQRRHKTNFS